MAVLSPALPMRLLLLLVALVMSDSMIHAAVNASGTQMIHQFNLGLEEKNAANRLDVILDTIHTVVQTSSSSAATTEHVMCLVEVWNGPTTMRKVVQNLSTSFPYAIHRIDPAYMSTDAAKDKAPTYSPACSSRDFSCDGNDDTVVACLLKNCVLDALKDQTSDGVAACFMQCLRPCLVEFTQGGCGDCLIEMSYDVYSSQRTLSDAATYCFEDNSQPWTNSLGMVVVASVPITLVETRNYPAFLASRGYILVEVPSWNNTAVACTHLSVTTNNIPYVAGASTPYASWEEENLGQTILLADRMEELRDAYPNQVLCGDFNHGPAIPSADVYAVVPAAYAYLANVSKGVAPWTNTYIDQLHANPLCTACKELFISPTVPPAVYDHIYIRGPFWCSVNTTEVLHSVVPWRAYRSFDQWVSLMDVESHMCILSPLSDHYAIRLCRSQDQTTVCSMTTPLNTSTNYCSNNDDTINAAPATTITTRAHAIRMVWFVLTTATTLFF